MAIKDWIIIIGVISLVIERIIRWIFRFIRPEKEIDSIAMDMVKLNEKRAWNSTPLVFFYFYKRALKKQERYSKDFVEYLKNKEKEINQKLENLEQATNNEFAIMLE